MSGGSRCSAAAPRRQHTCWQPHRRDWLVGSCRCCSSFAAAGQHWGAGRKASPCGGAAGGESRHHPSWQHQPPLHGAPCLGCGGAAVRGAATAGAAAAPGAATRGCRTRPPASQPAAKGADVHPLCQLDAQHVGCGARGQRRGGTGRSRRCSHAYRPTCSARPSPQLPSLQLRNCPPGALTALAPRPRPPAAPTHPPPPPPRAPTQQNGSHPGIEAGRKGGHPFHRSHTRRRQRQPNSCRQGREGSECEWAEAGVKGQCDQPVGTPGRHRGEGWGRHEQAGSSRARTMLPGMRQRHSSMHGTGCRQPDIPSAMLLT